MWFLNTLHFLLFYSQVKKSTLNPNAKEFNPIKPQMPMVRLFVPASLEMHFYFNFSLFLCFNGHEVLSYLNLWTVKHVFSSQRPADCVKSHLIEYEDTVTNWAAFRFIYLFLCCPIDEAQHCAHSTSTNSTKPSGPSAPGRTGLTLQPALPFLRGTWTFPPAAVFLITDILYRVFGCNNDAGSLILTPDMWTHDFRGKIRLVVGPQLGSPATV